MQQNQIVSYVQDANGGMRCVQTATEFVAVQQATAYYRVSTARQGRSGLGIEAQRDAVTRFAAAENFELIAEFVEIETGKGSDALDRRPSGADFPPFKQQTICKSRAPVANGKSLSASFPQ
jgi:hypothetical protein